MAMPSGPELFVLGTAAIDRRGRRERVDSPEGQIEQTTRHDRELLAEAGCSDTEVPGALVYCKTSGVVRAFHAGWAELHRPSPSMVGDICRLDLLFQAELIAGPVAEVAQGVCR
jgi:hypothetical protein